MQRFSGCDEAKSFMHSGEVSGDELIHLDEEVTNANYMNCGGFKLSAPTKHAIHHCSNVQQPIRSCDHKNMCLPHHYGGNVLHGGFLNQPDVQPRSRSAIP